MTYIASVLSQDNLYKEPKVLGTFVDNHDVPRFINGTIDNGLQRLKLALAFLFGFRGVPIIYYGTEIAMEGGKDPDNRRDMEFGANPEVTEYVRDLIALRKDNPTLSYGQTKILKVTDDTLVFMREWGNQQTVIFINNSSAEKEIIIRLPDNMCGANWEPIWGISIISYDYGFIKCYIQKKSASYYNVK